MDQGLGLLGAGAIRNRLFSMTPSGFVSAGRPHPALSQWERGRGEGGGLGLVVGNIGIVGVDVTARASPGEFRGVRRRPVSVRKRVAKINQTSRGACPRQTEDHFILCRIAISFKMATTSFRNRQSALAGSTQASVAG
jgi:hypothetical protein